MLKPKEQRQYYRMQIECPASFRLVGETDFAGAVVKNLSSDGMLVWMDRWVAPGSSIQMHIEPASSITPSLDAHVRVLRCDRLDVDDQTYAAACRIEHIFDPAG